MIRMIRYKDGSPTPGYAISIMKEGRVVETRCRGFADLSSKTPITPKTNFRLASLSKQFTAMASMILRERKDLEYEDQLGNYFPDFFEQGKRVTVRQLLTHTSGIPDHEKPLYQQLRPGKYATMIDALNVLKAQERFLFSAGSRYQYSDSSYVLLALIIEKVSGLSYRKFLKKNIFLPLGMKNSDVYDEKNQSIKFRAYGYRSSSPIQNSKMYYNESGRSEYNTFSKSNFGTKGAYELFDDDPLNFIVGDEGVYSSIGDIAKWDRAWEEEILVSRKSLIEAMTPTRLMNGECGKAGLSWLIRSYRNRKIVYQDGSWVGFRNIILKIPEQKLTVVILSNRTDLDTERQRVSLAYKLAQEFL